MPGSSGLPSARLVGRDRLFVAAKRVVGGGLLVERVGLVGEAVEKLVHVERVVVLSGEILAGGQPGIGAAAALFVLFAASS